MASNLESMATEDLLALRERLQAQRNDLQGRIVAKSRELGVDPALSLAVAHTESLFDPNAVSPTGVKGLFQVTVPTGQRFGQTAENRFDPDVSIHAGVSELKRLLTTHKGNVRQALAGYGDPQQKNYPDLVLAQYPRYAQMTRETQAPALSEMSTEELLRLRDTLRAKQAPAPPAPVAPAVAPGLSATEPSDIVLPIEKAAPAPPVPNAAEGPMAPRVLPGNLDVRLREGLGLSQPGTPPPRMLDLATLATEGGKLAGSMGVQGMTTAAGATLGAMTGPLAPVATPALMGLGSYYGHRLSQQLGLTPGEPELMPRTLADYLAFSPAVEGPARAALRWSRGGKALRAAEDATTAARQQAQEELATAQAARAQTIAERERASAAAISKATTTAREQTEAAHANWRRQMGEHQQELRGRLIHHRDLTRTAEREAFEANVAAREAYRTKTTEAYEEALATARSKTAEWKQKMADYTTDLEGQKLQRQALITNAEERVRQANAAAQAAYETQGQEAYQTALRQARAAQQEQVAAQRAYQEAVTAHAEAVQQAQGLPKRFSPPRPADMPAGMERVSQHYYGQFADEHASLPISMSPAAAKIQEVAEQVGRPFASEQPSRIQAMIRELEDLPETTVGTLYGMMKDLGPLTRSTDSKTRGAAKQLFGALSDAMQAGAPQQTQALLQKAKVTWMQEEGVAALQEQLARRTRSSIIAETAQGLKLNPQALRSAVLDTRLELRKWLPPAEYRRLEAETRPFLNLPAMPKGAPPEGPLAAPMPAALGKVPAPPTPQTIWDLPASEQRAFRPATITEPPAPPDPVPVAAIPRPAMIEPDYPRPVPMTEPPQMPPPVQPPPPGPVPWEPPPVLRDVAPVEPVLQMPKLARLGLESGLPLLIGMGIGHPGTAAKVALSVAGGDLAMYGVARLLLSPVGRPLLQQAIQNGGVVSPELAALLGALAAEAQQEARPKERRR